MSDFSPQQGNTLLGSPSGAVDNVGIPKSDGTPGPGLSSIVLAPVEFHNAGAAAPDVPAGLRAAPNNATGPGENGSAGVSAANGIPPLAAVLDIKGAVVAPVNQTLRPDRSTGGGSLIQHRNPA